MKNRFFGKYYKFIAQNGFTFAIIVAYASNGKSIQLITKDKSYQICDPNSIIIENDTGFEFDINQNGLSLTGKLTIKELTPLSKKVMGPFSYVPFLECRHNIYSMYHEVDGAIRFNNKLILYSNGYGYIEGDEGRNFPRDYIWYNSVLPTKQSVTLAIAHIPFGLFSFTGVLCFIKTEEKEYYFCTWNFVDVLQAENNRIILQKGKYMLEIDIDDKDGHFLKAPAKGNMVRMIKENLVVPSRYRLMYDNDIIIENTDSLSSCEWVKQDR